MSVNPIPMPIQPPASPISSRNNSLSYIVTALGITFIVMGGIILTMLVRPPPSDNMPIIVVIIGFGSATMAGIAAFLKGEQTAKAVQDVHIIMNSRFSEWMEQTRLAVEASMIQAKAEGILEGRKNVELPIVIPTTPIKIELVSSPPVFTPENNPQQRTTDAP